MDHTLADLEPIGARVRRLRISQHMTATELAMRAGVSEDAIRKIESGRSKQPSFVTGVHIAAALDVPPALLAFGEAGTSAGDPSPSLSHVLRVLRDAKSELAALGVAHAAVFGSVARGDATADSDVDVLLDPDPDRPFTLIALSQIGLMLGDRLGRRVDVATKRALSQHDRRIVDLAVYAF
jgi:predicted nucleotidyltransferase/DNA-binding Xre family transcriptional regulator